jgi:hypothetical protein
MGQTIPNIGQIRLKIPVRHNQTPGDTLPRLSSVPTPLHAMLIPYGFDGVNPKRG